MEDIPEGVDPKEYLLQRAQETEGSPETGLDMSMHSSSGSGRLSLNSSGKGLAKTLLHHVSNNRLHA